MSSIVGGISVETPKFTVVKTLAGLTGAELRKYAPQVRAEVLYDSSSSSAIMDNLNTPFRTLAGYIFGGNSSRSGGSSEKVAMTAPVVLQTGPSQKIAMTAPVVLQTGSASGAAGGDGSKRVMCFIMPSKYQTIADLPEPKDSRVTLLEVPERTYVAVTFRGMMSQAVASTREAELRAAAKNEGLELSADPHAVQYCSYNPPWCLPWLRTNDILIPVAE